MNQKVVDNIMTRDEQEIRSTLFSSIALAIFAVVAPILAYHSCFIPEKEASSIWFQRSGSITVIFMGVPTKRNNG